jgi:tRNA-2-methylthio-N6-dimethylallyladenosine synthase
VARLHAAGFGEVHLIGQNVNSYRPPELTGLENVKGATPFSKLLRAVAKTGMRRIKFTTSFPRDFHPDIVKAIEENENLCNWIHLPVQSGSDRILRAMRRGHTVDDYKRRVDTIRASSRNMSLTSDIIVGFPGETRDDLRQTMTLLEYCQYDSAYIFKYSRRTGTPAAELADDVLPEEKKVRFLELESLQRSVQARNLNRYLGKTLTVLVEKLSTKSPNDLSGHTTCHRVVNFAGDSALLGNIVEVTIKEKKANTLFGLLREV